MGSGAKSTANNKGGCFTMKTSKKIARVLAAALCLTTLLSCVSATAETYATVQGGGLNLRQTASLDAKVLGQEPTGTWITVLEEGSVWSKVQVNGKTGYMMSKYLASAQPNIMYVRTNTGVGLNLRTAPGMNGVIITSFLPGTPVTVLKKGVDWYYVSVAGLKGYMGSRFLSASPAAQPAAPGAAKLYNPNGNKIGNFRKAPTLNGALIAAYPVGTPVTVLKSGKDWCKVEIYGTQGYVSAYFLKK